MIERREITGVVLAGGLGSRMGGLDKGLVLHGARPLAQHALDRLLPQVGALAINANRNLGEYAGFGVPVWPDRHDDRPGPLAGMLSALERCTTPYLVTVPCDAPFFPTDLVARLADALVVNDADLAVAVADDGASRALQPVFCLMKVSLRASLEAALAAGERRVGAWALRQRHAVAAFSDPRAFVNLNTPDDLARAEAP